MCKTVTPEGRDGVISPVGPGPASTAGCLKGAPPAFSRQIIHIAEGNEESGIIPDIRKWCSTDISGAHGEVRAGGYVTIGKYPAIAYAGDTTAAPGGVCNSQFLGNTAELRGTGRADVEIAVPVFDQDLTDKLLVFLGASGFNQPCPSCRDREKSW